MSLLQTYLNRDENWQYQFTQGKKISVLPNIFTASLHISDTYKYRAVDYIQLKCVKQYNKKEPLPEKCSVQLLEFDTDTSTLQ